PVLWISRCVYELPGRSRHLCCGSWMRVPVSLMHCASLTASALPEAGGVAHPPKPAAKAAARPAPMKVDFSMSHLRSRLAMILPLLTGCPAGGFHRRNASLPACRQGSRAGTIGGLANGMHPSIQDIGVMALTSEKKGGILAQFRCGLDDTGST